LKNVRVLDGGFPKWVKEGRPTEEEADAGSEEDYKVTINKDIYKNYADIASLEKEIAEGKSDVQIIDARGEAAYAAGHIPVSKTLFFKKFQNDDGTVKKPEEVRQILDESGLDASRHIVNSCGSGISASYAFSALKHAGLTNISLYDGAWSEYVRYYVLANLVL
jgi:thiosulfate/3-mercaptopyruvate sulfurtransferase